MPSRGEGCRAVEPATAGSGSVSLPGTKRGGTPLEPAAGTAAPRGDGGCEWPADQRNVLVSKTVVRSSGMNCGATFSRLEVFWGMRPLGRAPHPSPTQGWRTQCRWHWGVGGVFGSSGMKLVGYWGPPASFPSPPNAGLASGEGDRCVAVSWGGISCGRTRDGRFGQRLAARYKTGRDAP